MGTAPSVDLDDGVLERLEAYVTTFAKPFGRIQRTRWSQSYLEGLLLDGERKSVQPLSQRVVLPRNGVDAEQALRHFVTHSRWDHQAVLQQYRTLVADSFADEQAVVLLDDTSFPKKGRHSVGVASQWCGTLGKQSTCQVAVSLHYAAPGGDYPLTLRLYLPNEWTTNPARMDTAHVPEQERIFKTKGQIALDLLDEVLTERLPHRAVLADAGYGIDGHLRNGLEARGEHYLVGISAAVRAFAEQPQWYVPPKPPMGRPFVRRYPHPLGPQALAVQEIAETLPRTTVTWRQGTKGPLQAEFAWVRVWPAQRRQHGHRVKDVPDNAADARWLLVEWRTDGTIKYALSNLPADTTLDAAVRMWKMRWQVEQGYQQLKEELGLDHFEGRSWAGFHHHATLCFLAYGFLALERARAAAEAALGEYSEDDAHHPPLGRRLLTAV